MAAIRRKEDLRNCKFFLENYGNFQVWSGMYPAYWWHTIFFLLVLIIHDGFLAYTAFIGMEDLALFAESTHFVIMIGIMTLGILNVSIYKKNNEDIFWALEFGLHNYQDTVDEESQKKIEQFREEADARKKLYSKVIAYTMYSACIVLSAVRPIFEYFSGKYDNAKYVDGITRTMPVACWLPYDTSKWPFHCLALLSEYYIITFGTCAVIGNDVVFLRLAEELVYELRVMTLLLQNIRKRTEFVMENKLNMVPRNLEKSPSWTYCVRLCLAHSVQHHINFIKVFTYLSEMMYYLLFFMLFGSVYLLCLSGVLFTSDDVEFAPKFTFAVFMGGELVNTFLFCWYGQQIQDMSRELRDVIYSTDWFEYSTAVKCHCLMMQMRCLNELKLSAGGLMDASLSTFGNMACRVKNDLRNCKFFINNYGQYQIWSGLYPVYWQIPAIYTVLGIIHASFLFKTFLITYGTNDLQLCVEAIHFLILLSVAIIATLNRNILTSEAETLFWAFDRGLHDYEETIDEESLAQMEDLSRNKEYRKKIFSRAFVVTIYLATFALGVVRPIFYYISGKYDNPRYDDSINRWLPVYHWHPLDFTLWPEFLITLAAAYYTISSTALLAIANTVIFLRIAEEIIYELNVLTLLLKNVQARAEMVWKKTRFHNEFKKDQIWAKCLRLCLIHCVKHHEAIIEVFSLFDQVYTYILLTIFLSSVYMLCLSGILFAAGIRVWITQLPRYSR